MIFSLFAHTDVDQSKECLVYTPPLYQTHTRPGTVIGIHVHTIYANYGISQSPWIGGVTRSLNSSIFHKQWKHPFHLDAHLFFGSLNDKLPMIFRFVHDHMHLLSSFLPPTGLGERGGGVRSVSFAFRCTWRIPQALSSIQLRLTRRFMSLLLTSLHLWPRIHDVKPAFILQISVYFTTDVRPLKAATIMTICVAWWFAHAFWPLFVYACLRCYFT